MIYNSMSCVFSYNLNALNTLFYSLIQSNTDPQAIKWLNDKSVLANEEGFFNKFKIAFSIVSRKVSKDIVLLKESDVSIINDLIPNFSISSWSIKKLCRIWLIMQIDAEDRNTYIDKVEELFRDADLNELATLYTALPLFAYPEHWKKQCAEGIRSNIGNVLDAVIMDNPYPAANLDENAWNQLVLKAFFTDKDTSRIVGFRNRMNHNLLKALNDYIKERKAAGRFVKPELMKIVNILFE